MIINIFYPFIRGLAGGDIYFDRLTQILDMDQYRYRINKYSYLEIMVRNILKRKLPKTDLIHTTDETGVAFYDANTPLIVTCLHLPFDKYYYKYCSLKQKLFYKYLLLPTIIKSFSKAKVIIAISKYTKKSIQQICGQNLDVRIIYPGIDINKYKPGDCRRDDNKIHLLFAGNMTKRKGADLLPLIMSNLGEKYVLHYTSGLRTDVPKQFNLSNMVPLGRLSEQELIKEYQKCDILLFPSRLEGFGYSVAEAMSCGKPVITTNCSSLPELVINNKGGFLCEIDDIDDFVAKIILLSNNPNLRKSMGQFNRQRIIVKFNLKKMGKQYQKLYREVLVSYCQ